jgi:flagellar protein FliS
MNMRMKAAYAQTDRETSVAAARPIDLIVLVYQRVLDHLKHGRQQMLDGVDSSTALSNGLQLLHGGLEACLDHEKGGEVASNLGAIYSWAAREILLARLKQESERLTSVIDVLTTVSQAWQQHADPTKAVENLPVWQPPQTEPFDMALRKSIAA